MYRFEQISQDRSSLYDYFSYTSWNQMNFSEKRNCLQALENYFAYQQGRPAVPVVEKIIDGYGYYDSDENIIYVNQDLIDHGNFEPYADMFHPSMPESNIQLFDTIAHEGYHAYENYSMKHPEIHSDKHQLSEWAMNEGLYYGCNEKNGERYLIQPQERDAWAYGYEKTSEAFDEIEERNGLEPGRHEYEKMSMLYSYDEALSKLYPLSRTF